VVHPRNNRLFEHVSMTAPHYFESGSLNHLILKATVPLATLFKPAWVRRSIAQGQSVKTVAETSRECQIPALERGKLAPSQSVA
jgi:hypothetical protein